VATSHKVILTLLDEVHDGEPSIRMGHKDEHDGAQAAYALAKFGQSDDALRLLPPISSTCPT
jgi:hypothetical protein